MAGVKLVDNLASFASVPNKRRTKQAKALRLNPDAYAGTLSRDKDVSRDKTSGSAAWNSLLVANNPDVRDKDFYANARSFVTPDLDGFKPADDAKIKWMQLAQETWPNPKVGAFSEDQRPDFVDVDQFYNAYYDSLLVDDADFVSGPTTIGRIFPQPAAAGDAKQDPNVEGNFPSQGVAV